MALTSVRRSNACGEEEERFLVVISSPNRCGDDEPCLAEEEE